MCSPECEIGEIRTGTRFLEGRLTCRMVFHQTGRKKKKKAKIYTQQRLGRIASNQDLDSCS
jgi:hypothetical protein